MVTCVSVGVERRGNQSTQAARRGINVCNNFAAPAARHGAGPIDRLPGGTGLWALVQSTSKYLVIFGR